MMSTRHPLYQEIRAIIEEIRPAPDLKRVDAFLAGLPAIPASADLEQKAGLLSALYLLAAEKLQVPAKLVRAPDHVFVRLCDTKRCVNVETLDQGKIRDDAYYAKNLTIPKAALEKRIYLRSLEGPKELAASLYLGLGYIAAQGGQLDVAAFLYQRAIDKAPGFVEPYSNLASIEGMLDKTEDALRLLQKAQSLNPTHYATLINIGVIYESQGKVQEARKPGSPEARKHYSAGIESNPLAVQAYRKRAKLHLALKDRNAALLDLERILVVQPRYCDVQEERNSIAKELGRPVQASRMEELRKIRGAVLSPLRRAQVRCFDVNTL